MWIRTGNVICHTSEFTRFYIDEMPNERFGIFGDESETRSVIFGTYRNLSRAEDAFNDFCSALERSENVYIIQESDKRW